MRGAAQQVSSRPYHAQNLRGTANNLEYFRDSTTVPERANWPNCDWDPHKPACRGASRINQTFGWRHVFTTVNGRIGYSSLTTKPGDVVCVFNLAKVPHILRKVENSSRDSTYTLVGEAYVYDMMDGEVEEFGLEDQDIWLRQRFTGSRPSHHSCEQHSRHLYRQLVSLSLLGCHSWMFTSTINDTFHIACFL